MKKLWHAQRGFTLMELIVSVGILSMIAGAIVAGLVQALGTKSMVVDEGLATDQLRRGLSYFATDVKMAKSTDLVDDGEPVSTCVLIWTDEFNDAWVTHSSSYAVVDDNLVRTYDGNAHTVAQRVVSVSFSRTGAIITIQLQVNAASGETETLSESTVMRPP